MAESNEVRKTVDVEKSCIVCGDNFKVRIRKSDGKIMSKCFYSPMQKYFLDGWGYQIKDYKAEDKWNRKNLKVHFKNRLWKIIAYTKPQRWIVSNIWWLFKGWQKIEYWECKDCCGD